jgi:hypothetical protein
MSLPRERANRLASDAFGTCSKTNLFGVCTLREPCMECAANSARHDAAAFKNLAIVAMTETSKDRDALRDVKEVIVNIGEKIDTHKFDAHELLRALREIAKAVRIEVAW